MLLLVQFNLQADIPTSERDALIALYNSTGGDSWTDNTNWKDAGNFAAAGTEGTWFGVTVVDDHVVSVSLPFNNLTGTIPSNIEDLTDLEFLALYENNLSGSLPSTIGNLSALTHLVLNDNALSGSLPASFSSLSSLQSLILSSNDFTGNPFDEVIGLTGLITLGLYDNQFSGTIPTAIDDLAVLEILRLEKNSFTGTIPTEIGNIGTLTYLGLNDNGFTGSIPSTIVNLTNLTDLFMNNNSLTGNIPAAIGDLVNLVNLNLRSNNLDGSIPSSITSCILLEVLDLTSNTLTGSIPSSIGSLTSLKILALSSNELSGTIPASIVSLSALLELSLNSNQLESTITANISGLTSLQIMRLNDNEFSGTIPTQIGQLINLEVLYLNSNNLTGAIPADIGDLPLLTILNLSLNTFTSIPSNMGSLTSLEELYLNNNEIAGSVPVELGDLSNLRILFLNNNLITGFPDFTGKFAALQDLYIQNNSLEFDDIVPNLGIPSTTFLYSPQADIGTESNIEVGFGGNISLQVDNHIGTNQYQWYKDGFELGAISASNIYSKTPANYTDAGEYYCKVTNTSATALTLTTEKYIVVVIGPPNVETVPATDVGQYAAKLHANVLDDRGRAVTERGIAWGLDPNPDKTDNVEIVAGTLGAYEANITGLNNGTTYHFRAFAENSEGITWGNDISFTTLEIGSNSKEYHIVFNTEELGLQLDDNPVLTRITKTQRVSEGTPGNFVKDIGAALVKEIFGDNLGTDILLTALEWWGYSPLQIYAGLDAEYGGYFEVKETSGADVSVNYPIDYTVEYPQANTFACGETVLIKTSYNIGSVPNMFEVTPPFYKTEVGAIFTDIGLTANLKFCLPKGPCLPVPYPCPTWSNPFKWCTHNICFPPAICSPELSFNLPLPLDFLEFEKPLFTVCPEGFDDNNAIINCANQSALITAIGPDYGITNEGDDKLCISPPPYPALPFPEMSICFSKPNPDDLSYERLEGGRKLKLSGNKEDIIEATLDLISLLDYAKFAGVPIVTAIELGPDFTIDIGDFSPSLAVDQFMTFEFVPDFTIQLDLGAEMVYQVINPQDNSVVSSGFGRYPNVQPGQHVRATIPNEMQDPVSTGPIFSMNGNLTSTVGHSYSMKLSYNILEIKIPGIFPNGWFAVPNKTIYDGKVGDPVTIENNTLQLTNFTATGDAEPFALDPMKPRIDITYFNVENVINIGGGERRVIYKMTATNNGDVPLYDTKLFFDLAEIYLNAQYYSINSITTHEGVSINTCCYNGDDVTNLLSDDFILGVGEDVTIVVDVTVKPEIAQIDVQGCFIPVTYSAVVSAEAYSPETLENPTGILITDSKHTCTHELYEDIDAENFPILADVDLGAAVIDELNDYALYGERKVRVARSMDLSWGNIGSSSNIYAEPLGGFYSEDPRIVGDIHGSNYIVINESSITADYAQVGRTVLLRGAESELILTGAISSNSDCVSTFDLPELNLPRINTRNSVTLTNNSSRSIDPGDVRYVTLYNNTELTLSSGTYSFLDLRLKGDDITINFDVTNGPITLNLHRWTNEYHHNLRFVKTGTAGTTRDIMINYPGTVDLTLRESFIQGSILAPNAEITFEDYSELQGSCYAEKVTIGPFSKFTYHHYVDLPESYLKRPIPEQIAGSNIETTLGNYPNPVKEMTTIYFNLPSEDNIDLSIYELTGRKILTLANGHFNTGRHDVTFTPENLSNGVYYYVLKTKSGSFTNKMNIVSR